MKKLKQIWNILFSATEIELGLPFVIQYSNTTDSQLNGVLFGFNDFCTTTNYGSSPELEIRNLQGGTYGRLINQSRSCPFTIGRMRFYSENKNNIKQTVKLIEVDSNGVELHVPISLIALQDLYQFSADSVDSVRKIKIHANTYIIFTVEPNSKMVFSIYPEKEVVVKQDYLKKSIHYIAIKWNFLKHKYSEKLSWVKNKFKRKK